MLSLLLSATFPLWIDADMVSIERCVGSKCIGRARIAALLLVIEKICSLRHYLGVARKPRLSFVRLDCTALKC